MAPSARTHPYKHESPSDRARRHLADVERAEHQAREQQRSHQPAQGSVMARRPLAYAWRDPGELIGLVPDQFLAPWGVPPMKAHHG